MYKCPPAAVPLGTDFHGGGYRKELSDGAALRIDHGDSHVPGDWYGCTLDRVDFDDDFDAVYRHGLCAPGHLVSVGSLEKSSAGLVCIHPFADHPSSAGCHGADLCKVVLSVSSL